ncbi:DUF3173 family protein, partial [Klebsiella pneumoniae]|nr:DUF3173 family protein [Klebsiella pneumoniae]
KTDDKDLDSSEKLLGAEFIVRKDGEESYLALKDTVTQAKEIADYKAAEADYLATVKSPFDNRRLGIAPAEIVEQLIGIPLSK